MRLPAAAGRLMQAEVEALSRALENPERPLIALVGGAKISTKLELLGNLIARVDILVLGGGMANTFLHAQGTAVGPLAVRAGHGRDRAPDHGRRRRPRAAKWCCRSTAGSRASSRPEPN